MSFLDPLCKKAAISSPLVSFHSISFKEWTAISATLSIKACSSFFMNKPFPPISWRLLSCISSPLDTIWIILVFKDGNFSIRISHCLIASGEDLVAILISLLNEYILKINFNYQLIS